MPIDPLSALADQLVQSLAKVLWNRPELSSLRERVQEVLKTRQFRTLTVQAFEEFERHLAGQLPDYFDEGFIRMPSVQTLLAQHIIDAVPVDIAALAQLYGKRHLRPSEAVEVQPLLDGYLLQLRDTFYHHPEYGQMLHIRDGRRMLEALDRIENRLAAFGDAVTGARRPPPGAKPRVFISYARKDGGMFAADLREKLLDAGIPLWQDRVGMEGGRDWWQQITEALDTVEFMVLVMTPHALQSEVIRREWRYARLQGVCVYPVKGVADSQLDYASLPRWMGDVHWYDLEYEWPKFLNDLNTRCEAPRVPFMVEDLPEVFVPRPDEFENIISRLLDETHEEPVAMTAALRGAGGFGKTTLARAICHDERVQQAFDDGILWVTLGEDVSASALMSKVRDLIETLSGERPGFEGLEAAVARLVELLAERDLLIVIDDVWKASDLRPFMQGGARCARLITTRDEAVLPRSAQKIIVESMAANEATELLSKSLEPTAEDHERMQKLAAQLGEWALMLKLTNGILHERVARGQTLSEALTYIHRVLEKRGIFGLNVQANTDDRREVAAATLGLSLELLTEDERDRLAELAIFAEDIHIPLVTISRLWGAAVGWDELDTEDVCTRLFDLSLLLDFSLTERYIRLHDVIRHYLMAQASERLSALHGRFLDGYNIARWRDLPEDEPYLWDWLAYHLIAADRGGALVETVRDVHFLAKKTFYRQVYAVESDLNSALQYAPDDEPLRRLTRLVTNAGYVLNRCDTVENTLETLVYRLEGDGLLNSLISPASSLRTPRLAPYVPLQDRFHPAQRRTLAGHSDRVRAVAISHHDRFIVSASEDHTLRVWDAASGQPTHALTGHSDGVGAVAISHDDRFIVSASWDRTLRVWDVASGQLIHTLTGHSDRVVAVAISHHDRFIVSASYDSTLRVWDAAAGQLIHTLTGHSGGVRAVAISHHDRFIVSASWDRTLRVWDAAAAQLIHTLTGHSRSVVAVAISHDDRFIVSASHDHTLRVWDAAAGSCLAVFYNEERLTACAWAYGGYRLFAGDGGGRVLFLEFLV